MMSLKCKSGPLGPDVFDNVAPLSDAQRLARYGKEGVTAFAKTTGKLKAHLDKVKKARALTKLRLRQISAGSNCEPLAQKEREG